MEGLTVVWDFDYSLIDTNSDTWVPEQCGSKALHSFIKDSHAKIQWTDLMELAQVSLLDEGVKIDAIISALQQMPCHDEVLAVISQLHGEGVPQHIVSDANQIFIQTFVDAKDIDKCFKSIVTNPAQVADGRVHIQRYHGPEREPHGCPRCPVNMCKGSILRDLKLDFKSRRSQGSLPDDSAQKTTQTHRVLYVGDGGGDLCPCLHLGPDDIVCAREGYPLARGLTSVFAENSDGKPQPTVLQWADGQQLARAIRTAVWPK